MPKRLDDKTVKVLLRNAHRDGYNKAIRELQDILGITAILDKLSNLANHMEDLETEMYNRRED